MANHKQFGLTGVSSNVQFGKGNGRIKIEGDVFKVRNTEDSDFLTIKAANPVDLQDLTTKAYVDSVAQGLVIKDAVVAATNSITSNLESATGINTMPNLAYSNTGNGQWTWIGVGAATFDGHTLADGDRVLIKDAVGADARGNGIWEYTLSTKKFARTEDANNLINDNIDTGKSAELRAGNFVFVEQGNVWGGSGWVLSSPAGTVSIGIDIISFSQFSRSTGIYADDGLGQDGNRVYIKTDGTTIYIDGSDELAVKSSGIEFQTLISRGVGNAEWGAVSLDEGSATQGNLLRSRGGLGANVSAYLDQSLYLSSQDFGTVELAVGTAYQVLRVDADGLLGYGAVDLGQPSAVTGVLGEANGGTGQSTYSQYDILIGNSANGLDVLGVGAANQSLRVSSTGVLEYGAVDLGANSVSDPGQEGVTGTLKTSNGGTGVNAYTKGDILISGQTTTSSQDGGLEALSVPTGAGTGNYILSIENNNEVRWISSGTIKGTQNSRQVAIAHSDVNIGDVIPGNARVVKVKLVITVPYVGTGMSMSVGDSAQHDRLMLDSEIDYSTEGIYVAELLQYYATATQLTVYVSGATAGNGYVVVDYVPN